MIVHDPCAAIFSPDPPSKLICEVLACFKFIVRYDINLSFCVRLNTLSERYLFLHRQRTLSTVLSLNVGRAKFTDLPLFMCVSEKLNKKKELPLFVDHLEQENGPRAFKFSIYGNGTTWPVLHFLIHLLES